MGQNTIIVTGASRGLGAAAALIAAAMGANVVLNARSAEALAEVAGQIEESGARALVVPGDVTDWDVCQALVERAVERFGRLDGLINNAGIIEPVQPIAGADVERWLYNLRVNVHGPLMLTKAALPQLRQHEGRVINVSSGASVSVVVGWSAYCTSKAALNHLTRVLAAEEPRVTALAVRPGIVDTEMQAQIRREGERGMTEGEHQRFMQYHQRGQLQPPEKPGRALAALALRAPRAWSGEFLSWDEGRVQRLAGS